jgi:hypothetical protein
VRNSRRVTKGSETVASSARDWMLAFKGTLHVVSDRGGQGSYEQYHRGPLLVGVCFNWSAGNLRSY